jgi:hypothetical protein
VLGYDLLPNNNYQSAIKIFNVTGGLIRKIVTNHSTFKFLKTGEIIASGGDKLVLLNNITGATIKSLVNYTNEEIFDFLVFPDEVNVAVSLFSNKISIANLKSGVQIRSLQEPDRASSMTNLNDRLLVTGYGDGRMFIWDIDNGNLIKSLSAHTEQITSLVTLKNNKFVSTSTESSIKIWDASSFNLLATLYGHVLGTESLVALPDGNFVTAGDTDFTMIKWSADLSENISSNFTECQSLLNLTNSTSDLISNTNSFSFSNSKPEINTDPSIEPTYPETISIISKASESNVVTSHATRQISTSNTNEPIVATVSSQLESRDSSIASTINIDPISKTQTESIVATVPSQLEIVDSPSTSTFNLDLTSTIPSRLKNDTTTRGTTTTISNSSSRSIMLPFVLIVNTILAITLSFI